MTRLEDDLHAALAGAAFEAGNDLIDDCTNMFGPLDPGVRVRLLALICNPSPDTWDNAHSIILNANVGLGRTLWQAVLTVDPTCPLSGAPERLGETLAPAKKWAGYAPDPLTVLNAIRNATREN